MLEYPEIRTIVGQMRNEIIGKTVESGTLVRKNGNMFMGDFEDEPLRFACLNGGTVAEVECLAPEIYIRLDNGYGILICQSGGRILYNRTPSDVPKNFNIIFNFTDGSSLTYTVALFTLGFYAATHGEWEKRAERSGLFDPLDGGTFGDFAEFINNRTDQGKTAVKVFLAKNVSGIMSTFAGEILLYAGIYPSRQMAKLSEKEHRNIYESMGKVIGAACECGGRTSESDLYGQRGKYKVTAERKHIGEDCPVCGGVLEKNSTGGVTAFCPNCQKK